MQDQVVKALDALRHKNYAAARDFIADFARENPLELQHYLIKGLSEIALEDWRTARETFTEAAGYLPHQPQLWSNLGLVQENLGQLREAAASYEHSLDLKADQADIYGNLSNVRRRQGRLLEAEKLAHRAYELGAPRVPALNVLGLALGKQGKFDAASKIFNEALRLEPGNRDVTANLANLAVDQLKFDVAWLLFAAARQAGDSAIIRRDEGMARLLAGDYARGWPLYEARLELPTALRVLPSCPRYRGEPLAGKKLLLLAEQGLGDTLQFSRYGRLLTDAGAELIWMVPKPLSRLLADNLTGQVVPEGEAVQADYYLPMMSLPLATQRLNISEAPALYVWRVPQEPVLPPAKDAKRRIGLVWAGSPTHERDHERSIPIELFAPLIKDVDAEYVAPFVGDALDDIGDLPIKRIDQHIKDFADTAAILRQLDCLITVDTAVAHLAGMLGVKTYLLLPHCPDWRWGTVGEATLWYPSMTLLRQPSYGDWDSVMANLVSHLNKAD